MSQQSSMPQKPNLPDTSFTAVINRSTTSTFGCHIPKGNKDDDQGIKKKNHGARTKGCELDMEGVWASSDGEVSLVSKFFYQFYCCFFNTSVNFLKFCQLLRYLYNFSFILFEVFNF